MLASLMCPVVGVMDEAWEGQVSEANSRQLALNLLLTDMSVLYDISEIHNG
jgi:hypothetical protein